MPGICTNPSPARSSRNRRAGDTVFGVMPFADMSHSFPRHAGSQRYRTCTRSDCAPHPNCDLLCLASFSSICEPTVSVSVSSSRAETGHDHQRQNLLFHLLETFVV